VADTEAIAPLLLLHVPPVVVLAKVVVEATHTDEAPVMAANDTGGLTVKATDVEKEPQLFTTK
jgi:hypothetical protein